MHLHSSHIVRSLKMCTDAYFFGGIPMSKIKSIINYFSIAELSLWGFSVFFIVFSYVFFSSSSTLTLTASLIGVTSLIFNAKGNPFGQFFSVVFSIIYGIISYSYAYYGEMITYLGMTAPMALFSLIAWLRHPYSEGKSEVKVNTLNLAEIFFMLFLSAVITYGLYFVLKIFNTANILPSTISVTTSFIAVYLTFRRSPYFALAYTANDIVLIILWQIAAKEDISYLSVSICFTMFLINDIYGFINWQKIKRRQESGQRYYT